MNFQTEVFQTPLDVSKNCIKSNIECRTWISSSIQHQSEALFTHILLQNAVFQKLEKSLKTQMNIVVKGFFSSPQPLLKNFQVYACLRQTVCSVQYNVPQISLFCRFFELYDMYVCLLSAPIQTRGWFLEISFSPPMLMADPSKHFPVLSRSCRYRGRTLELEERHHQCTILKLPTFETIRSSIEMKELVDDFISSNYYLLQFKKQKLTLPKGKRRQQSSCKSYEEK